jgi:putative ABC transport system substrate-binding protein
MNRRHALSLLAAAGTAQALGLGVGAAQAPHPPRRIGMLVGVANDREGQLRVATFRQHLQRLGWVEGDNVEIAVRWSGGDLAKIRAYADELVGLAPDILVGTSLPVTATLHQRTRSIPIVFLVVPDPVLNGFVANQARPGGNLTGFTNFESSMGAKWLETLREIAPRTDRLAVMFDPASSAQSERFLTVIAAAAQPSEIGVHSMAVRNAAEITAAIEQFASAPNGGLVVLPGNGLVCHRALLAALTARHRLPAVYPYRHFVQSGGLISYGIDTVDVFARSAAYVDRILRGAAPADLPVQEPQKFELVINKAAAAALGLEISPALVARANEVIG